VFDYGGNFGFAAVETQVPAGEAQWASCTNSAYGFEVSYPADWFVWDSPSAHLECAYFDPVTMEGLSQEQAFEQAGLTVKMYDASSVAAALAYLEDNSVTVENATVAGLPATLYESAPGEWGYRAYVVPLDGGRTLVLAAWGEVNAALQARADRVAASFFFGM